MNESISRAAGAGHGQCWSPAAMESAILGVGRVPSQRTTLYGSPPEERKAQIQATPLQILPLEQPMAKIKAEKKRA